MAIVKNDPFPGTDYNAYQSWQKVTLPSGQVVYVVPNNPGYVFDPIASNATGRKVFHTNPQQAIDAQKKQQDLQDQQNSPIGQITPVLAGTAGAVGGAYLINNLATPAHAIGVVGAGLPNAGAAIMSDGTIMSGGQVLGSATAGNAAAAATGAAGVPAAAGAVPATPEILSATATPAATSGFSLGGIGAAGNYLLPAAGALGAFDVLSHEYGPARSGLEGAASGAAIGSFFPGPGTIIGAGVGGLLGLGKGLMKHETTRERQNKVTDRLMQAAGSDAAAQTYVQGMREQFKSAPPDPSHPFHGQYSSWDEYKKAGLDAADLTGVEGNIDTYSPQEWARLTFDQRKAITQANIDSGLYYSKDGGVKISDKQKALENKDNVLKGFQAGAQAVTQTPVVPVNNAQAAAQGARNWSLSPGIGLDGKPMTPDQIKQAMANPNNLGR